MFPPNYRALRVPALEKTIHTIDKDVVIKQAHQSFVVLGNSKNESKDRSTEGSDKKKEKAKPINVPFQKIDLSRLRSPNIPYVGKIANRGRASNIPFADSDLDQYGPKQTSYSPRYSDEPAYKNVSNDERSMDELAASYPQGERIYRNKTDMQTFGLFDIR